MAAPAPAPDFPRVFGRYLLLDRLSRGGMGEIYLARVGEIEGFQKPCIIKKILPQLAADQNFIGRFVAEAQIAIKLQHANIAPVYEVGMVDGDYFLALEFVDGRDLRRMMNRAREGGRHIAIEAGLFVVREVASGLAYAHRRVDDAGKPMGLVHCDVSPPNVLLGFEGEVKLIDFGIARSAAPTADVNVGFGKVGYMAPEQLGEFGNRVDKRTDVYAAGVLLFELLTGGRPFEFAAEASGVEMAKQIREGAPHVSDRRPGLGKRFDELVGRAMQFDPDDRYPSAEELRDAIQRHLVEIAPTFSGERLGRTLRGLFADEMGDSEPTIAAARTGDFRPFDKALDEARSRTVSFALSSAWTSPPTGSRMPAPAAGPHTGGVRLPAPAAGATTPRPVPLPPVAPVPAVSAPVLPKTYILPPKPSRHRWPARVGLAAALAGLAFVAVFIVRSRTPQPLVLSNPAPPPSLVPEYTPRPAVIPVAPPSLPSPSAEPEGTDSVLPEPEATPMRGKKHKVAHAHVRPPKTPLTKEDVERRFQAVSSHYREFKKTNGSRLETRWTAFLSYYATQKTNLADVAKQLDGFEKLMKTP